MRRTPSLLVMVALVAGSVFLSQPVHADTYVLSASLAGTNEVPPNATGVTGAANVSIDTDTNQVCVTVSLTGAAIADIIAMHIHTGAAGVNGPVVVGFAPGATACSTASADLIAAILAAPANYYFNTHSANFPAGLARGQLVITQRPPGSTTTTTSTVTSTTSPGSSTTSTTTAQGSTTTTMVHGSSTTMGGTSTTAPVGARPIGARPAGAAQPVSAAPTFTG